MQTSRTLRQLEALKYKRASLVAKRDSPHTRSLGLTAALRIQEAIYALDKQIVAGDRIAACLGY